ncbi:ABC transporter permease [Alloiococcus sp. CFN-8]|uniref:ABC transporter permease n=1 Tax=Alloiococcus sp. CFN-8 TaxID=3416081 RepID=UPI003CF02085
MKTRGTTLNLILYEIRNVIGNPFIPIFGIAFPVVMSFVITRGFASQVPENMIKQANTGVFITLSLVIPMAIIFLGYAAMYSQEIENQISLRMRLFGISEKSLIIAKVIAQNIIVTISIVIYSVFGFLVLDIQIPRLSSALILILCLYLLGVIFFIFAHGISTIFKKFGPTYFVTMVLYFGIMVLCGMMGVSTENLPKALKAVASTLPMSYVSSDFIDFWQKGSYNFVPLIQSFIFLGAISCIILILSLYKDRRVVK